MADPKYLESILRQLKKGFLLALLLAILMGCGTTRYNHEKISSLYKKGYEIKLNGKPINPRLNYLDPDNLLTATKRKQILELVHKDNSPTWVDLSALEEKYERRKLDKHILVVINGIAIDDVDFDSVKIEQSTIQSLDFLSRDKLSNAISHASRSVLVVKTKQ